MFARSFYLATLTVTTGMLPASVAFAAGTEAHAVVIAGQATPPPGAPNFACATSGPLPGTNAFFGRGVRVPTEGMAYCGLSGGVQDNLSPTGPASANLDVTRAFNGGVTSLASGATAGFDRIGAFATGSNSGSHNAFEYAFNDAAAIVRDTVRLPGSGQGSVLLLFDIAGSLSGETISESYGLLNYQIGAASIVTAFTSYAGRNNGFARSPVLSTSISGFTASPNSVSGVAFGLPSFRQTIQLGTDLDFAYGLYVASFPAGFQGGTATTQSDFSAGARLSGFLLFDGLGNPIDMPLTGQSGTIYDKFGAHIPMTPGGVPEPASWALMIAGFGAAGASMRRKKVRQAAKLRFAR